VNIRNQAAQVEKETGRLEAFSDGVFAIALTLLVLDIKVPSTSEVEDRGTLLNALLSHWPTFLAFATSFVSILIMWANHHNMFKYIKRTDNNFLLLNGLLLFGVTIFPFPTSLLADYLSNPTEQKTAAAVYSSVALLIALAYNFMWWYAAHNHRLLDIRVDPAFVKQTRRQYLLGPVLYSLSFFFSFVNVAFSLAIYIGLMVFFALPRRVNSSDMRSAALGEDRS
jgi:uncharacterized membrane protein